jgi:hypothetical protein
MIMEIQFYLFFISILTILTNQKNINEKNIKSGKLKNKIYILNFLKFKCFIQKVVNFMFH